MLQHLKDGDQIKILPNILKDGKYGDTIIKKTIYYINDTCNGGFYFIDNNNFLNNSFENKTFRYYFYCLINGTYSLSYCGKQLYDIIISDINKPINIVIDRTRLNYPSYSKTHHSEFDNYPREITEDFLKTKSMYMEDIFRNMGIDNPKQLKRLEETIGFETISKLKNRQRELKLKNILF
jgi:hypothetical protein